MPTSSIHQTMHSKGRMIISEPGGGRGLEGGDKGQVETDNCETRKGGWIFMNSGRVNLPKAAVVPPGLMRSFSSGTDHKGHHEFLGALLRHWPPKLTVEKKDGSIDTRVAGEVGGVAPLHHFGTKGFRNEQNILGFSTRIWVLPLGFCHRLLYLW